MLHEKSNNNTIINNILYGNTDGIALWRSSNNLIQNNSITDNKKSGIRANIASNNNLITNNRILHNQKYGIFFYDNAQANIIHENILRNDVTAIYINTSKNIINNNIIEDNKRGVFFRGKAENNIITQNTISYSSEYGIYTNSHKNLTNTLGVNTLYKNRHDIAAQDASQTLSVRN